MVLTGVGSTLLVVALLGALLNLQDARRSDPRGWFLGSVWGPLYPATLGALALLYDLLRVLASFLP